MLRSTLILSFIFLSACRPAADESSSKNILDKNDIRFLSVKDIEADRAAQSVVALLNVVTVGPNVYGSTYCSAFFISPRHLLSAAHCYQERDTTAFESGYKAREGDQGLLSFTQLGRDLRLRFSGIPDAAYLQEEWKKRPYLGQPKFLDREHDVVIWELPEGTQQNFISWAEKGQDLNALRILAHPNSNPLTEAGSCSGIMVGAERVLRHDCDTLTGSSGGLVVDKDGRAVAMHVLGGGQNLWTYYQAKQSFETLEESATLLEGKAASIKTWECADEASEEARKACVVSGGRNRAVGISYIRRLVLEKDEVLALAIDLASQPLVENEISPSCTGDNSIQKGLLQP